MAIFVLIKIILFKATQWTCHNCVSCWRHWHWRSSQENPSSHSDHPRGHFWWGVWQNGPQYFRILGIQRRIKKQGDILILKNWIRLNNFLYRLLVKSKSCGSCSCRLTLCSWRSTPWWRRMTNRSCRSTPRLVSTTMPNSGKRKFSPWKMPQKWIPRSTRPQSTTSTTSGWTEILDVLVIGNFI